MDNKQLHNVENRLTSHDGQTGNNAEDFLKNSLSDEDPGGNLSILFS